MGKKVKESVRAINLLEVEILFSGPKSNKAAFLEQFEAEFAASRQRIQTLKAETDAIAKKTDAILFGLA